jgi:nitroreductase
MSDYFEIVKRRRSVRRFLDHAVEPEKLEQILECARAAPSAGNLQAYAIVVVRSADRRRALAQAALDQEFIAEAPIVLVFLQDIERARSRYGRRGEALYSVQDAAIACTHAQLAATALDLASCWVGAFHVDAVRDLLRAPEAMPPVAILPIGYPAEEPSPTGRRPASELIRVETY